MIKESNEIREKLNLSDSTSIKDILLDYTEKEISKIVKQYKENMKNNQLQYIPCAIQLNYYDVMKMYGLNESILYAMNEKKEIEDFINVMRNSGYYVSTADRFINQAKQINLPIYICWLNINNNNPFTNK